MSPPKLPRFPDLPLSPLSSLRSFIRQGQSQIEKARDGIRSIADDLRGTEAVTGRTESQKERLLPPAATETSAEEKAATEIATACVPCALGHMSLSSGLLKEAVRFKGEGITSNEILDRIAIVLEELNSLEREDLTPEKILELPPWERAIAEETLEQSRQLRHKLETIRTIEELEQVAAGTKRYYIKLLRQWYKGRFGRLGAEKAEAIVQRIGEK